jgi:hypothetical protein
MFFNFRTSSVLFNLSIIITIIVASILPASVQAKIHDSEPAKGAAGSEGVSPTGHLNPDGSLHLDGNFSGSFDLDGWDVQMDPVHGPVFQPANAPSALALGEWASLGGGVPASPNNSVNAIAVSGTDVYVGGNFTNLNNTDTLDFIAKWNGTSWSALGSNGAGGGSLGAVVSKILVNGTDIYVGGSFSNVNNNGVVLNAADYVAKWNGTNWSALGSNGAGDGSLNGQVNALAISGTDIYVGGQFSNVNNSGSVLTAADYVAKWNGTAWSALSSNGASDGSLASGSQVFAIVTSGSNVYVGGQFTNVNNNGAVLDTADYVAQWNGTNWSALSSNGAGDGSLNSYVRAMAVSGSNIYIGGQFTNVNNNGTALGAADHIALWDGTNWSALGSNGSGGGSISSQVLGITVNGTDVYVSGLFNNVNNNGTAIGAADYIAKWNGTNWSALGSNGAGNGSLNYYLGAIAVSGSNVYIGGLFTNVNNNGTNTGLSYLALFNGTDWGAVSASLLEGAIRSEVAAVAVSGTNVYVGGIFTNANNIPEADYIARWDGTNWSALGSNGDNNGALNASVSSMVVSGTDIYVAGYFGNAANIAEADYIARWDGTNWSALGSDGSGNGSITSQIFDIAISGTDLYVGGIFQDVNNNGTVLGAADYIAKWDGTNWSALGSNGAGDGSLNIWVNALAVSGATLYAVGSFTDVNNNGAVLGAADYVAKWDGTNWSALSSDGAGDGSIEGSIYAVAISGTDVYIGGDFAYVNDNGNFVPSSAYIAKWDGTNWSALSSDANGGSSLNGQVNAIVVSGSNIYVGGYFTNVNNNGAMLTAADYAVKWDGTNWSALGSNNLGNGAIPSTTNAHVQTMTIEGDSLYTGGLFFNVSNNGTTLPYADHIAAYGILDPSPLVTFITRASADPTSANSVNFDVLFSEDVTGVDTTDFTLTTTGVSGAAVSGVSGTGTTYTVSVTTGSGNGTIRLDVLNDGTIQDLALNPLAAAFNTGETYTVNKALTLTSTAANDGWILESTETSGNGGTLNSTATNFSLGDDAANKQYRAILHFDTSSLPDNAVITSATLRIKKQGVVGSNPFNILGDLKASVRKPGFGAVTLALADFKSAPGKNNVATFGITPVSNWYSALINNAGRVYINRTGTTQFRLAFTTDDNNDNGADLMKFFSGNAGAANRPQLVIQYYVP